MSEWTLIDSYITGSRNRPALFDKRYPIYRGLVPGTVSNPPYIGQHPLAIEPPPSLPSQHRYLCLDQLLTHDSKPWYSSSIEYKSVIGQHIHRVSSLYTKYRTKEGTKGTLGLCVLRLHLPSVMPQFKLAFGAISELKEFNWHRT